MSKFVIDVSEHQGIIDWDTVKNHIDGAIIRCGYGEDRKDYDDKQWKRNITECERLEIPRGVYLYSYALNEEDVRSELQHILRLIKGHSFQLPIYIDVEENGTQKIAPTTCKIICDGLKAAGYKTGVYSNTYWWDHYLKSVTDYPRWVAQYNSICTYKGSYDIWQYSSSGSIPGIRGNVDTNHCYTEFNQIGGSNFTFKPIDEIVNEVIKGLWGNYPSRKIKLEEAGYNYDEIQSKVDEKYNIIKPIYYKIKSGDTLSDIAIRFDTTVGNIQNLNRIEDPNLIYTDKTIRVR